MFFILFITLTTYTSINFPNLVMEKVGRIGWILILGMAVLFSGAAILITKLNNRFPGKVLFDYSQEIAGKFVSRVIAFYFILYFTVISVYLKIKLVNFLTGNFLLKTPQFVLLAFCVALFAYVAYKGVTNVARLFELFGTVFLVMTLVIYTLMLFQGMVYNILPLWNPSEVQLLTHAIPDFLLPFGGIEVLLIIPFTKKNKKAPFVAFLTLLFIGVFYVLLVEGTLSILGINNTIQYRDTLIEAIKVVYIPVIERTDIFYLTVGLVSLFAGMFVVFLCILEYLCRLLVRQKRVVITVILAVVLYILSLIGVIVDDMSDMLSAFFPYLVTVSTFVIPGSLLLVSVIRKKRGVEKAEDNI